jgi:hypothetical protein
MSVASKRRRRVARRAGTWVRSGLTDAPKRAAKPRPEYPNRPNGFEHPGDGQRGCKGAPCPR